MARIVLVHGDHSVLDSLRKLLERLGHECACTVSPVAALEWVVSSRPDLIVIGEQVPELEGAQLFELVRCFLGSRCPPIVAAPSSGGEQLLAEISAALPTAFVFGTPGLCDKVA